MSLLILRSLDAPISITWCIRIAEAMTSSPQLPNHLYQHDHWYQRSIMGLDIYFSSKGLMGWNGQIQC